MPIDPNHGEQAKAEQIKKEQMQYEMGEENFAETESSIEKESIDHRAALSSLAEPDFVQEPLNLYAGFFKRLLAYGLDILIIMSLQNVVSKAFLTFTSLPVDAGFFSVVSLIKTAILLLYFVLMTKLNHGQTLGKMLFGLRVAPIDGGDLTWSSVIVREGFGRFVLERFEILYFLLIFHPKKQHVVDLLCDTVVLDLRVSEAYLAGVKDQQLGKDRSCLIEPSY